MIRACLPPRACQVYNIAAESPFRSPLGILMFCKQSPLVAAAAVCSALLRCVWLRFPMGIQVRHSSQSECQRLSHVSYYKGNNGIMKRRPLNSLNCEQADLRRREPHSENRIQFVLKLARQCLPQKLDLPRELLRRRLHPSCPPTPSALYKGTRAFRVRQGEPGEESCKPRKVEDIYIYPEGDENFFRQRFAPIAQSISAPAEGEGDRLCTLILGPIRPDPRMRVLFRTRTHTASSRLRA